MFSAYRSVHACDRQTRNTSVIVKTFVITQETPSATCRQSDKTTSSFATLIRLYVFPRLKQFSGVRSRLYEGRPSHKNNSETYKIFYFISNGVIITFCVNSILKEICCSPCQTIRNKYLIKSRATNRESVKQRWTSASASRDCVYLFTSCHWYSSSLPRYSLS